MENNSTTRTIGIIGPSGHGKTTLYSAISEILHTKAGLFSDDLGNGHYNFIDCDSPDECEKKNMDLAILILDVGDDPGVAEDFISFAAQAGIIRLFIFLNKSDLADDPEIFEIAEIGIGEILDNYGYDNEYIPIHYGSALMALQDVNSFWSEPVIEMLHSIEKKI